MTTGPLDTDSQAQRLAAFLTAHQGWRIFPGEFGTWHAERDDEHGSDTHVRHQFDDLIDVLEQRYA